MKNIVEKFGKTVGWVNDLGIYDIRREKFAGAVLSLKYSNFVKFSVRKLQESSNHLVLLDFSVIELV